VYCRWFSYCFIKTAYCVDKHRRDVELFSIHLESLDYSGKTLMFDTVVKQTYNSHLICVSEYWNINCLTQLMSHWCLTVKTLCTWCYRCAVTSLVTINDSCYSSNKMAFRCAVCERPFNLCNGCKSSSKTINTKLSRKFCADQGTALCLLTKLITSVRYLARQEAR